MTTKTRVFLHYLLYLFLNVCQALFVACIAEILILFLISSVYLISYHFASFKNLFIIALIFFQIILLAYILMKVFWLSQITFKKFIFLFETENQELIQNKLSAYLFPATSKKSPLVQEYKKRLEKDLKSSFHKTNFGLLFPFKYLLLLIFIFITSFNSKIQMKIKESRQWVVLGSFYNPLTSQLKFEFTNVDKAYLKNESIRLNIAIKGVPLFPVQLKVLDINGLLIKEKIASKFIQINENNFLVNFELKGFSNKVFLQCFSGVDQSKKILLNIVDFPRIIESKYELEYPKYLNKKKKELAYLPKKILIGSRFFEEVFFNKKLSKIEVSQNDFKIIKKENHYRLDTLIKTNLDYQISFRDLDDVLSKSRKRFIEVKHDELPNIKVLNPVSPKKIKSGFLESLPLKIKITDDFLIEKVQVEITSRQKFEMTYMSSREEIDIDIESSNQLMIETNLEIRSIYLQEGDRVKFIVKAWDQLKSRGPAYSMTGILYVPYTFEESQESEESAQEIMQDLKEIAQEQKVQETMLKKLSNKKDSYKKVSLSDQKKFKDLLKKQKLLQEKAKQIDKKIGESLKNDRDKNLLDEATLRKLDQIKDLYEDLMKQMDRDVSMMNQMNKSMKDVSQKKLNKMMKKFDSKKYSEELDRTLSALKKVQAKRKLQTNLKKIEQLQKEHNTLQKSLEKNKENNLKASKELQKKWEEIKKSLKELQKNKSLDQSLKDELQNKSKMMDQLSKEYKKMEDQLSKRESSKAKENNKKIAKSLEKMKQDLKKSIKKSQKEVMKVNLEQLDKFLKESNSQSKFLLSIKRQISFYKGLQRKRYAAQEFSFLRSSALHLQKQMAKEYKENLSFSKTCITISKLLQEQIIKAVKDYESDTPPRNAKPIYDAYATNNQQSLLLLNLKEQLQKQKQQSQMQQFMDSLEKLSDDQRDLNQKAQKMGESMSQRSQYEQEQLQEQMAFQQELIRKSTDRLYESYQNKLKMAKKLKSISKEMKDVEDGIRKSDLEKGSKTRKKQNKIEYKLLEMQNAMKEQKESKKRKSNHSKIQNKQLGMDSDRGTKKSSINIYKNLEIPKRFQGLIQGYFQSLDQK